MRTLLRMRMRLAIDPGTGPLCELDCEFALDKSAPAGGFGDAKCHRFKHIGRITAPHWSLPLPWGPFGLVKIAPVPGCACGRLCHPAWVTSPNPPNKETLVLVQS